MRYWVCKPSFLDENLSIFSVLLKKSKVKIHLHQSIFRHYELIVDAKTKIVTVNSLGKPVKMPIELYKIF